MNLTGNDGQIVAFSDEHQRIFNNAIQILVKIFWSWA